MYLFISLLASRRLDSQQCALVPTAKEVSSRYVVPKRHTVTLTLTQDVEDSWKEKSLFKVILAPIEPILGSFSKNIMLICSRWHECLIASYLKWYSCHENPSNLPFLLHTSLLIPPPPPVDIQPNFCLPQRARPCWRARKHTHHFVRPEPLPPQIWRVQDVAVILELCAGKFYFYTSGRKKKQTNKLQLKFCKNGAAAREPGHSHGAAVGSDEQQRFYLQKKKITVTLNRRAALFYYHFLKQRWTYFLIALRPNKEVQGCSAKTLFSLWIMNYRSSRSRRPAEVRM